MKTETLVGIVGVVWTTCLVLFLVALICYVPKSEASELYPVTITDHEARLIDQCIGEVFDATDGMANNFIRYSAVVAATGECVFRVAYPNGSIHEFSDFMDDWVGESVIQVPPELLGYRF